MERYNLNKGSKEYISGNRICLCRVEHNIIGSTVPLDSAESTNDLFEKAKNGKRKEALEQLLTPIGVLRGEDPALIAEMRKQLEREGELRGILPLIKYDKNQQQLSLSGIVHSILLPNHNNLKTIEPKWRLIYVREHDNTPVPYKNILDGIELNEKFIRWGFTLGPVEVESNGGKTVPFRTVILQI